MQGEVTHGGPASRVALWAAVGGVVGGLLVALLRGALTLDEHESRATTLGAIGFTAAFVAPFLVLLASLRLRHTGQRRAIWLGCMALAVALAVLTIFGAGLLFLCIAGALGWAWVDARKSEPSRRNRLSPVLTIWIVLAFGGALGLLWIRDTPACWDGTAWSATESASTRSCTSDIVDTTEGVLAVGSTVLGAVGVITILRIWHIGDERPPGEQRMRLRAATE